MQRPGKGICTVRTPYPLRHIATVNAGHLSVQASAVGYTLTYFTTPKPQLVTWTVVGLTIAKFKPLMLHWLLAGVKVKLKILLWPTVSQPVSVSSTHLGPKTRYLLLSQSFEFVDEGCCLCRDDGSVVYNCCWHSPAQSFFGPSPAEPMTIFYCLRFETPPTWRARSPYLYRPKTGWHSYTPRHWVPFSSSPTTRRTTVETFEPALTRGSSLAGV
jgi:hypothetical protein